MASTAGLGLVPAPGRPGRAVAGVRGRAAVRPDQPVRRRARPERGGARAAALCAGSTWPPAAARRLGPAPLLAPGYSSRRHVHRRPGRRLLAACDAALSDDGASLSSYEAGRRAASCAGSGPGRRGARLGGQLAALSRLETG